MIRRVASAGALVALLLAGCGPGAPPVVDGPSATDSATDTASAPGGIDVACAESEDNVLRWVCTAQADPPSPVTITLRRAGGDGPARTFTRDVVAAEHELTLWLMPPDTDHVWEATAGDRVATGAFRTGLLPDTVRVAIAVDGEATFPYALATSPCGAAGAAAVIVGTEGEVLWYHAFRQAPYETATLNAVSFTEDGTVLGIVGVDIVEVDLLGRERPRLVWGVDFERVVHHDVFRKDGLTWALRKDQVSWNGDDYVMDGFYVFDASGAVVADWALFDVFQPTSPTGPYGADYSHANSIWVGEEGDVYLSFRHLSAVARVDGDLTSPTFGAITWRLSGDPDDRDFGSDFTLTAPDGISPTFERQHNVHVLPDGTLAMFDNRGEFFDPSRLLHLSLDPIAGQASIDAVYPLPQHCDFQGGAWHTAAGNPVATCAPIGTGYEFDRGLTDTWRWSMELRCAVGATFYVPRFVPLEASDLEP